MVRVRGLGIRRTQGPSRAPTSRCRIRPAGGAGRALLRARCDARPGRVDDDDHLGFATHIGFTEVDREVEQSRAVADVPAAPPFPAGIEVVTGTECPGLWEESYDAFGREVLADFAVRTPLDVTAEQWSTSWAGDPMFLAVHDGEVIGCAGLLRDADQPRRAESALTAVRRDWRGRGLAVHLKLRVLAWASAHGVDEVYTWTQDGNSAMRAVNERLGYTTTRTSVSVSRPLPLA